MLLWSHVSITVQNVGVKIAWIQETAMALVSSPFSHAGRGRQAGVDPGGGHGAALKSIYP